MDLLCIRYILIFYINLYIATSVNCYTDQGAPSIEEPVRARVVKELDRNRQPQHQFEYATHGQVSSDQQKYNYPYNIHDKVYDKQSIYKDPNNQIQHPIKKLEWPIYKGTKGDQYHNAAGYDASRKQYSNNPQLYNPPISQPPYTTPNFNQVHQPVEKYSLPNQYQNTDGYNQQLSQNLDKYYASQNPSIIIQPPYRLPAQPKNYINYQSGPKTFDQHVPDVLSQGKPIISGVLDDDHKVYDKFNGKVPKIVNLNSVLPKQIYPGRNQPFYNRRKYPIESDVSGVREFVDNNVKPIYDRINNPSESEIPDIGQTAHAQFNNYLPKDNVDKFNANRPIPDNTDEMEFVSNKLVDPIQSSILDGIQYADDNVKPVYNKIYESTQSGIPGAKRYLDDNVNSVRDKIIEPIKSDISGVKQYVDDNFGPVYDAINEPKQSGIPDIRQTAHKFNNYQPIDEIGNLNAKQPILGNTNEMGFAPDESTDTDKLTIPDVVQYTRDKIDPLSNEISQSIKPDISGSNRFVRGNVEPYYSKRNKPIQPSIPEVNRKVHNELNEIKPPNVGININGPKLSASGKIRSGQPVNPGEPKVPYVPNNFHQNPSVFDNSNKLYYKPSINPINQNTYPLQQNLGYSGHNNVPIGPQIPGIHNRPLYKKESIKPFGTPISGQQIDSDSYLLDNINDENNLNQLEKVYENPDENHKLRRTTVTPLEEFVQLMYTAKEKNPVDFVLNGIQDAVGNTLDAVGLAGEAISQFIPYGEIISEKFAKTYDKFKSLTTKGTEAVTNSISGIFEKIGEEIQARIPGAVWCNSKNNNNPQDGVDYCCQQHDMYDDNIKSGEEKEGLINNGFFKRSLCKHDEEFYRCLKDFAKSKDGGETPESERARSIGKTYFNLLKLQCFDERPPATCQRYSYVFKIVKNKCEDYAYDKNGVKELQWFDQPNF